MPKILPSEPRFPEISRTIDIGHSKIAYRVAGQGPDLVFVHGWPLHSATFRAIVPHFTPHFRCHLFDLPGAGATLSEPGAPLDLGSHPESLRAAIAAVGITHFGLIAHDSGGYVARAIAAEDPRVFALVLGDTEIPGHTPGVIALLHKLANFSFGPALVRKSLGARAFRRSSLGFGGCFQRLELIDGEFHDLFVAPMLASDAAARRGLELVRALDVRLIDQLPALHARIQAPVQLIWGADDPIFPLPLARAMVTQFRPAASLEVLPGGKVFVHEEQPEAWSQLALSFVRGVVASQRGSEATRAHS
jgi:haloalkane dehalogenase